MLDVGQIQKFNIYPNFEQVSQPNKLKVEKMSETDPAFLLKEGAGTVDVNAKVDLVQDRETNNLKPSGSFGKFTEVKLYNSDFGFNESSHDFFIKVDRGAFVDNKYPTDGIMRLKAYLNKLDDARVA